MVSPLIYRLSLIVLWCFSGTLGAIVLGLPAQAHQIPSLSVEASFLKDRTFEITVNLDPRLFLSDQPSSLPPVPIEWYRDQSEEERKKTYASASAYLEKALRLDFSGDVIPLPDCTHRAMDGATNQEVGDETKEVHLLAVAKGKVPPGAKSFRAVLAQNAGVSMILMCSFEGEMEKKPNVVFPGETSREFLLPHMPEPIVEVAPVKETGLVATSRQAMGMPIVSIGCLALAALLILWYRKSRGGVR